MLPQKELESRLGFNVNPDAQQGLVRRDLDRFDGWIHEQVAVAGEGHWDEGDGKHGESRNKDAFCEHGEGSFSSVSVAGIV
jgi:hypothetical protein